MDDKIVDINGFIEYTKRKQEDYIYNVVQTNIYNRNRFVEFLTDLHNLCEYELIDELGNQHFRRQPSSKTFDEVILKVDAESLAVGIKIYHKPTMRLSEWELWEDGFIEGFVRTSGRNEPDYFIWSYTRMKHLHYLLTKYQHDFIY
jgi:hypothetical protein